MKYMKLGFLVLLVSCATRRVDLKALHASGLPGEWDGDYGSKMKISCHGWIDYKIHEPNMFYSKDSQESHGDVIRKIQKHTFIAGAPFAAPLPEETFKVGKWPMEREGKTEMVVDDRVWVCTKKFYCLKHPQ